MSDSSRPHGLQPTRLLRPWDFPSKSTGMGCHRLLWLKRLPFPIVYSCLLCCRLIAHISVGSFLGFLFCSILNMTQLCSREGNGTPLQYSCLENPMDGGAWWAAIHGVAKSRTRLSDFTFTFHFHALEKEMATHLCFCLEKPRDGGVWWAAVYGVTQSRTRLKRLSSSSRAVL